MPTVIRRYDGHLAKHLGDGLLVYFGYPVAHEDDAQRAVRAGLEIVAAIQQARPSTLRETVIACLFRSASAFTPVSSSSGRSAVGEKARDPGDLGETPNIAARLQGKAEPDTLVISAATYRLVPACSSVRTSGYRHSKASPLLCLCIASSGRVRAQNRFEVAISTGLTPLIGRDLELGLLRERWRAGQRRRRASSVAQWRGRDWQIPFGTDAQRAGLGRGATRIEFRCSPYHQNSAFYSIIEHLQRLLQFQREDTPQTKLTKLQQVLGDLSLPPGRYPAATSGLAVVAPA